MPRRIFTFGCSFTNYYWPTWADLILYKNDGFNLGIRGGGFDTILYRIMEADRVCKLTSDDQIIVIFTTPLRWDLIIDEANPSWGTAGQVITSNNTKYEGELFCLAGLMYKSFNNIILIRDYLEARNLNYQFGSVNDLFNDVGNYFENIDIGESTAGLMNYVKNNVEIKLTDFHKFLHETNVKEWNITKYFRDGKDYHPRPLQYYKWVKDVLLNNIDINFNVIEDDIKLIESDIDSFKYSNEVEKLNKNHPLFYKHRIDERIYFSIPKEENLQSENLNVNLNKSEKRLI